MNDSLNLSSALSYMTSHMDHFTNDLIECLKIPSISTLPSSSSDVLSCASHVKSEMEHVGLRNIQQFDDYGPPILYADYLVDPTKPTLMFYGHYDVQPVDPLNLWDSPPFEPEIRDGYLFARGASDNKGMFYAQLKAIESYLKSVGTLPVNVKFLIEGEEEVGSNGLLQFINDYSGMCTCDALLVSDSPMFSESQPSICTGFRGLIYLDCHVKSMNHDVHSGQLGGGVPNIIHYISNCISSMKDPFTNKVLIPGFYDDVKLPPDAFDSSSNIATSHLNNLDQFYSLGDHANNNFYNNIWYRPTLDCNGIQSGFVSEGAKTVIPCEASFKLSCRLVADQDPDRIKDLVTSYVATFFPSTFSVHVRSLGPLAKPLVVDTTDLYIQTAIKALHDTHQTNIIVQGEGGSIPVLAEFQSLFNVPLVLVGLNAPNDNIHAPNERFKLDHYRNGIEMYIRYINLL